MTQQDILISFLHKSVSSKPWDISGKNGLPDTSQFLEKLRKSNTFSRSCKISEIEQLQPANRS